MQSTDRDTPAPTDGTGTIGLNRLCREIAAELSAETFCLLVIRRTGAANRLVHYLDSESPNVSVLSRRLADVGKGLLARAGASAKPCCWTGYEAISGLRWADMVPSPLAGTSGVAFPVFAEDGYIGLMVFLGDSLALSDETLPDIHARCFALFQSVPKRLPADPVALPTRISKRERQCLALTAEGSTSEAIAARLGLSVHTANQYLTNIVLKLNATNRVHAVAKALRLGLID